MTDSLSDLRQRAAQAFASGAYAQSAELLAQALVLAPEEAGVLSAMGYTLSRQGRLPEAADHFDRAVRARPTDAALLRDAAAVNRKAGRPEAALAHYRAAYRLAGHDIALLGQIVDLMQHLGRAEQALVVIDGTLALAPQSAGLHYLRGMALSALGRRRDERQAYETALKLDPKLVDAHTNLGVLARDELRLQDALRHFKQALAIDPDNAGARNNRAQTNLLLGQYAHGWRDYEWRWRDGGQTRPVEGAPWLGETALTGLTLLVHAEQGLGDTLQFSRYVPALAAQAGQVVLQVQPPLLALLKANLPEVTVLAADEPLPAFDRHVPLLSLPLALAARGAEPWPLARPLQAAASSQAAWAERLDTMFDGPRRPRIGLSWSGNAVHPDDHNRSIPFAQLAALLDAPCDFVCIQKDVREADLQAIDAWRGRGAAARLALPPLEDFHDTAGLVANLDRVISVDTAAAHLAGSMAVPTWLLLPAMPDWRWQLQRADTPWYPSVELLRCAQGWPALLEGLRQRLTAQA
ncbi:tetratricopeptide repeat protein [Bordetella genomosp. 12]|uniref:Glycosyltransferase n=1 Tax=Bordetella genomosp. 12 TaxID=463035 RepID=A0A261VW21_9BORD|nr:tetratricopeptide repeat protein [Bordetella genomosp. 12]OZI77800.1 glycosyltransferase [Bordetella genomosp. 12]